MSYILEHCIAVASFLLAFVLLTDVFRKNRQPGGTMAWALAIVLIPYVGVPLYLLFGGRKIKQVQEAKSGLYLDGGNETGDTDMPPLSLADQALRSGALPPPRPGHEVDLVFSGEEAFRRMVDLIEGAKRSVYVTTFILGRDEVLPVHGGLLARKAREGVEVRLLLDGLGSLWTKYRFVRPIVDAGGRVGHFLPVLPIRRRWSANLRNHRKIIVVDDSAAMVGGMNLSTLFMGPTPNPDRFLDASVFLRGPVVEDIRDIFISDWRYATGQDGTTAALIETGEYGDRILQAAASGPDVPDDAMHDALVCAIMEAKVRVWVVTPYFVPDEPLLKAMTLKARMGCDVRILVPRRSNHRIPDWARRPALRRLRTAGAKVYVYPKGMIRAKLLVFDDTLAVTGSPNLDMRSMYLNFEIALFHHSPADVDVVANWIAALMAESDCWEPRPNPTLLNEWTEGLSKLVSPLL